MKKLAIILLSQLMCFQAFAWRESNGGNGVEAEAKNIAYNLLNDMWKIPVLRVLYQDSDYDIIQRKNLKLDGMKTDAYTVSNTESEKTLIFIDQDNWNTLDFNQKKLLILHEMTHFMFHRDTQYIFSNMAVGKMEHYWKLASKYPTSEFPFEDEMINSVKSCSLVPFISSYLLVADVNYQMNSSNKTVKELVLESNCDAIKNYAPLKQQLDKALN